MIHSIGNNRHPLMVNSIRCQFKICWVQKTYINDSSAAGSVTLMNFDEQSVMGRALSQQLVNHIDVCSRKKLDRLSIMTYDNKKIWNQS
jgi:hypothetical protein